MFSVSLKGRRSRHTSIATGHQLSSLTIEIVLSPKSLHKSSMVYNPTTAIANSPTHLTLNTHPNEQPVMAIQ